MKKIDKKKLKEIYREFSSEIERYIENELKLNYKPVEWLFLDADEFGEYLQGIIFGDIPYWENGREYWIYNKTKYSDIFYLISTGILEVIYNHGNKAIGLIRTDMPFSYQLYVLIHAYIHSVIFENHYITKYYQDAINYYVNMSNKFSQEISDFEKTYGESHIVKLMDILSLLASLSVDFVKNQENNKIIIDLEHAESLIDNYNNDREFKLPKENTEDILFFLYYLGHLPYYIKRLTHIMRIREIYKRSIYRIKYVHEGLCTFYENQIYDKLLPKFYSIIKKYNLTGASELIFTTIQNKHFINYFNNIIALDEKDDKKYLLLDFNNLIYCILNFLNDPYKFGFLYFDYNKHKLFKEINPFSLTDEYLFIFSNADIINYLFKKYIANHLTLKNYNQEIMQYYSCITSDEFKLLPENSAFYDFVDKFIKNFYKQKLLKGYIPKEGYYQNKLFINVVYDNLILKLSEFIKNNNKNEFEICNDKKYNIFFDERLELILDDNLIINTTIYLNNNINKYFPINEIKLIQERQN